MKIQVSLGMAACAMIASAQAPLKVDGRTVTLGPPTAVTVGLKDVNWSPTGKALLYDAVDADGYHQGFYRTTDEKAKSVLRIPEGTTFQHWKWLPNRLAVIEVLSRELPDEDAVRWSVYLLDAQKFTARELAHWVFPKSANVSSKLDVSPTRDHAIFTLKDESGEHPFVLLDGAESLVPAHDIAAAIAAGSSFVGWSLDGTAYYAEAGELRIASRGITLSRGTGSAIEYLFEVESDSSHKGPIIFLSANRLLVLENMRAPDAGWPVLEVMPWNGRLRQISSRGPNLDEPFWPRVHAEGAPAQVLAAERSGTSGSLWMVENTPDGERPTGALLIAAEGKQAWFDPPQSFVAYETDGALFVRKILLSR